MLVNQQPDSRVPITRSRKGKALLTDARKQPRISGLCKSGKRHNACSTELCVCWCHDLEHELRSTLPEADVPLRKRSPNSRLEEGPRFKDGSYFSRVRRKP
jgi:hypothetical protein